ncbi:thiamine-phosphate pyrophosphorylase [Dongia mobilis]|uniref:Thiamine-phosphate pyrophosphorylase n=1 Tax=Dongia mobilis TaxID=578943 RepID=A0A4R6WD72_9PROT|nr:thiamine phosphate synthase [Dongia mobilis]TDQ77597.1 thiamine-phosphate pyrophosphorylase [Dongia mobilis]
MVALVLRAAAELDVACLRIAGLDEARVRIAAREILQPAQDAGIAVLLDSVELVKSLGADGVHLADPMDYAAARRVLGDRASIGVACPLERHMAMEAAEAGADYVQFDYDLARAGESLDLIAWWSEMMTVPSVVALPPEPVTAGTVMAAGADFMAPDADLWSRPDPIRLLREMLAAA